MSSKKNNKSNVKWWLLIIVLLLLLPVLLGKTYLYKAIYYNFAGIEDYKIFNNGIVAAGTATPWQRSDHYTQQIPDTLATYLKKLETIGLVVLSDRKLLVEKYWDGFSDSSLSGSFSAAKSITSLLVGAAIREGKIKSVDEPVGNYLPAFKEGEKAKVTIKHLLTMSSGSNWDESYANPFSVTTELYYGTDLYKTATNIEIIHPPGTLYYYKSGDTQLLGLLVEKATGQSLAAYASEKLWKPLGAQHDALWSIDKPGGNAKAYCCFNTNAPDFARLGQLMLDSGKINGVPVIDSSYFSASITPCLLPDETGETCDYYGYQWWMVPGKPGIFYARGILGQYIICMPDKRMVIVRMGRKRDEKIGVTPAEVLKLIAWGENL